MSRSKFKDIVFPFFGKRDNPYDVVFKKDRILVREGNNIFIGKLADLITTDNQHLDYLARLAGIDNRIVFDYTCRNLSELLNSKAYWGIDSVGKVFDLANPQKFKAKVSSIRKFKKGLIWVTGVSYPMIVNSTIDLENVDLKVLKVVLLYIDNEWIIYKFTYDISTSEYIVV